MGKSPSEKSLPFIIPQKKRMFKVYLILREGWGIIAGEAAQRAAVTGRLTRRPSVVIGHWSFSLRTKFVRWRKRLTTPLLTVRPRKRSNFVAMTIATTNDQ
jgi:hypothetical protein